MPVAPIQGTAPQRMPKWYRQKLLQHPSAAQRAALRHLWPRWGIPTPQYGCQLDLRQCFPVPTQRTVLDIGFGMGDALVSVAVARPDWNFVGLEWHRAGTAHCLSLIEVAGVENVRLMGGDAVKLLERHISPASALNEVWIWFPDPWPKPGDERLRLVRPEVVRLLARCLSPTGAVLHIATDVEEYAVHVSSVLASMRGEGWSPCHGCDGRLPQRPEWRPQTRYERKGHEEGRCSHDLRFRFRPPNDASQLPAAAECDAGAAESPAGAPTAQPTPMSNATCPSFHHVDGCPAVQSPR